MKKQKFQQNIMIHRSIKPTHPGEMLREDFMPDYGLTVADLARHLGVSRQTVNENRFAGTRSGFRMILCFSSQKGKRNL